MARTRTADGKRVSIGLKVSEAKYAAIEAARGGMPRALWLESAVDAALGWDGSRVVPAGTPVRVPHIDFDTPAGNPQAPARIGAGLSRMAREPEPPACRHPAASVVDGVCQDCGDEVYS